MPGFLNCAMHSETSVRPCRLLLTLRKQPRPTAALTLLLLLVCLILFLLMAIGLDVPLLEAIVTGQTGIVLLFATRRFDRGCPSHIERCGPTGLASFLLRSITIPFKNLIKHLSFYPLSPADPLPSSLVPSRTCSSARIIPSSLVLSSTCSSVKTPDTCLDPNHHLCHNNNTTTLDLDPDP
jgi:hypothetical protein